MSQPASFLPPAFLENVRAPLGDAFPDFLAAHDTPAPISLRINPAKIDPQSAYDRIPWAQNGYYLPKRPVFTADPWLHGGAYYVQEASSMLLEQAFRQIPDLEKPLLALDLCAAPGGKSTHLLSLLHPDSLLVANEVIQSRFSLLQENISKWGAANVVLSNQDPEAIAQSGLQFDLILVDAPCSGEGLFRKNPEACQEWSPGQVAQCSARQSRILGCAIDALKPGGVLIYSTCTYEEAENFVPISAYAEQGLLSSIPLILNKDWGFTSLETAQGIGYQAYPHKVRGEGFFMSCWRKIADTPPKNTAYQHEVPQAMSGKEVQGLQKWVRPEQDFQWFQDRQGRIKAIPSANWSDLQEVARCLRIRQAGIEIGSIKGDELIPAHALAVSTIINPELPGIELTLAQAQAYLRKDTFAADYDQKGWARIMFRGIGLGWGKLLPGRINNYYPTEWRIRMTIESGSLPVFE